MLAAAFPLSGMRIPFNSRAAPAIAGTAVVIHDRFEPERDELLARSRALMERHPLYQQLSPQAV